MSLLKHNKGFLFAWAFCFLTAFILMIGTSAVAVFVKRPAPPAPLVASDGTVLSQGERPKTVEELLEENRQRPANLSATQWRELRDVLNVLPAHAKNIALVQVYVTGRRDLVLKQSDFVFSHFDRLEKATQDDWKSLQDWKNNSNLEHPDILQSLQQEFLSGTLAVWQVQKVLENREQYEAWRKAIESSTQLVDRLVPALKIMGLKFDAPSAVEQHPDPQLSLREYSIYRPGLDVKLPVPSLPVISFDAKTMLAQLDKPALSTGSTSAARASSGTTVPPTVSTSNDSDDPTLPLPDELHRLATKFEVYAEQLMVFSKMEGIEKEQATPQMVVAATKMVAPLKQDLAKHPLRWRDLDLLERSAVLMSQEPAEQLLSQYRMHCFATLKEFYSQMAANASAEKKIQSNLFDDKALQEKGVHEEIAKQLLDNSGKYMAKADGPQGNSVFQGEFKDAKDLLAKDSVDFDYAKRWNEIASRLKSQ